MYKYTWLNVMHISHYNVFLKGYIVGIRVSHAIKKKTNPTPLKLNLRHLHDTQQHCCTCWYPDQVKKSLT